MLAPRRLALAALGFWCAGAFVSAQGVTDIDVRHRAGQTFVTWHELVGRGIKYRVYRSDRVMRTSADLGAAELLGEVDDRSSRNQGRSLSTGVEHTWIIEDGGAPLAVDQG